MEKFSVLDTWLNTASPSSSAGTRDQYMRRMKGFCSFIEESPEQIVESYRKRKTMIERDNFKSEYAMKIKAYHSNLKQQGNARNTIHTTITVVKSFFKHNDMPLGNIPRIRRFSAYHNRDITHEEIKVILNVSNPRERAAYALMAQSGLRPHSLTQLQIEDFEDILSEKPIIPQKITVPQHKAKGKFREYFTFCSVETAQYIRQYLKTKASLNSKSYVFTKYGHEDTPMGRSSLSVLFKKTVEGLQKNGVLDFEVRKGKPSQLHLYTLRKFFRKYSAQAGYDFVQYWLGHVLKNQDEHYFSTDPEFHRKQYKEKAMPHLRIETRTPTEREQTMIKLEDRLKRQENTMGVLMRQIDLIMEENRELRESLEKSGLKIEKSKVIDWDTQKEWDRRVREGEFRRAKKKESEKNTT